MYRGLQNQLALLVRVSSSPAALTGQVVANGQHLAVTGCRKDDPANPVYILSVYGEGYKFVG